MFYSQAVWDLVRDCAFFHLQFVNLGNEPSGGHHERWEGILVVVVVTL